MNLFLDTISSQNIIILFDNYRNILKKYLFDVKLNESTLLIELFHNFLNENNISYEDLENIIVVNWPGSFTWVRTTTLFVNTINFVTQKNITPINYFELFENYPIIKTSSKRDVFLKLYKDSQIQIIQNDDLENLLKDYSTIYWDYEIKYKSLIKVPDYENIIKNIVLENNKIITPFYLKKPNIS